MSKSPTKPEASDLVTDNPYLHLSEDRDFSPRDVSQAGFPISFSDEIRALQVKSSQQLLGDEFNSLSQSLNQVVCLLVEDDPTHAMIISNVLLKNLAEVQIATTIAEAEQRFLNHRFDLVVSDLSLPDCSPDQTVLCLKKIIGDVPLIVMTSSIAVSDAVHSLKAGANDFIAKDFSNAFAEAVAISLKRTIKEANLVKQCSDVLEKLAVLKQVNDVSSEGIAIFDSEGKHIYTNSAFESYKIISFVDLKLGSNVNLEQRIFESLVRLASNEVLRSELVDRESGNFLDLTIRKINFNSVRGKLNEIIAVTIKNNSLLRNRDSRIRDLISMTTHDLKGPLGAIIMGAEILSSELTEDRQRLIVNRLISAANTACGFIDRVLTADAISSGLAILTPEFISPGEVISQVVDDLKPNSSSKRQTIHFENNLTNQHWMLDKIGFKRVIANLISNALKFSGFDTRITIEAQVSNFWLEVVISDQGPGIDNEQIANLFKRYSRTASGVGLPGSGLGLFIVKSIIEAHGGDITVRSRVGEGTMFVLCFPKSPPIDGAGRLYVLTD